MKIEPPRIPQLPKIVVETEQQKTAKTEATGISSTPDIVEASKSNTLADQVQAAADQNEGNTGDEGLNSEQQKLASTFHPENEHLEDASFFLKDARSSEEDRKNSALQLPFMHEQQENPLLAKMKDSTQKLKDELSSTTVHDPSEKDFSDMAPGLHVNIRDQFNNAVGKKNQDLVNMGLTFAADRLKSDDPTSKGPQGGGPTFGKGMFEDGNLGGDVTPAEIEAAKKKYAREHPDPPPTDSTNATPPPPPDDSVKKPSIKDVIINFILGAETPRGVVLPPAPPDAETGKNMLDGFRAIFGGKGRTPESESRKGGGGLGIPDPENYQANLPESIKKLEEFFKNQLQNLKPHPGGEKAHTTDAVGTEVGSVDNLLLKQGNLGLLGNPGEAPQRGGQTGSYSGGSNPSVFGGNIDYGPDSDKTGWTGRTIQDDPGGVHFGPEEPAAGMPDSTKSDASDNSVDLTSLYQALEEIRRLDPALLIQFAEHLKKSE